jgi:2-methylaconitate cis-trans-isomerase PrpF
MRGGTSTGLVLWDRLVPEDALLRDELLRHLMGVPHEGRLPGNRQVTGLGRGPATSNKVFIAGLDAGCTPPRLVSTLAQLAADHGDIDWSVNCGNMSAALQPWALDLGLLSAPAAAGECEVDIRNTNTGVITTSRMVLRSGGDAAQAEIPGVPGAFPGVDLFLHDPVGAKTGSLLPTGLPEDEILGHRVSCVDVAVPMVIADAADFGKTAQEAPRELEADERFMAALRAVWVEAGLRMRLKRRDGSAMGAEDLARSETVPKVCIVAPARGTGHLAVRYFTPQTAHASMAVSGGCCLAAAALVPGTVAHRLARGLGPVGEDWGDIAVGLENPAGVLDATVVARRGGASGLDIRRAAYRRSAQILLRGHVPLYRASPALAQALLRLV